MWYRSILLLGICLSAPALYGQQPDTATIVRPYDLPSEEEGAVILPEAAESAWPVPKKALMWAIIPGGGQMYNRRWWKVPLVVGGFYVLYRTLDYNQDLYRRLRTAYELKLDNQEHEFSQTGIDNVATLRNLRDRYDKSTQMSYVFMVLGYALQGIEAYVDAHLRQFDIDDDLSFRLKPVLGTSPLGQQPVMGIGLIIPLNK